MKKNVIVVDGEVYERNEYDVEVWPVEHPSFHFVGYWLPVNDGVLDFDDECCDNFEWFGDEQEY